MEPTQLSSGNSSSRSINKRRHLCHCGEAVIVLSSSEVSSHGRRYVACGRVPRCSFFEWIDNEDDTKSEWLKQKERRIRCFCGDTLVLRSSGTPKNPNRRFISCLNRRCKFFKWVDEEEKVGFGRRQPSFAGDVAFLNSQHHFGRVEGEIREVEAQERKIKRLSIEVERLIVEIGQVDNCVGRLCVEFNSVQEQVGRLEENIKKQSRMQLMFLLFFVVPIAAVIYGKV